MSKLSRTYPQNLWSVVFLLLGGILIGGSAATMPWYFTQATKYNPGLVIVQIAGVIVGLVFAIICITNLVGAVWPEEWQR